MPKKAASLYNFVLGEFGSKVVAVAIHAPPKGKAGCFEVSLDGRLVHSKHTMGHGRAETEEERDALIAHITAELRRRKPIN